MLIALMELQKIDTELRVLSKCIESTPRLLKEIETQRTEAQLAHAETLEGIRLKQVLAKELEGDIENSTKRMKMAESRLLLIKTNTEYQAMLKEIATMKTNADTSETRFLQLAEDLENLKPVIEEKNKEWEAISADFDQRIAQAERAAAAAKKELGARRCERDPFLAILDGPTIKQYEKLLDIRKGQALCHAKNYICGGCHMALPPQMYNQVIKADTLNQCPQCMRFLYFQAPEVVGTQAEHAEA